MLRYLKLWRHYALVHRRRDARKLALLAHSDYFDSAYYLDLYRDVAAAGFDPVIHYVDYGAAERRNPSPYFNTAGYLRQSSDALNSALNPLEHFLRRGRHDAALAAAVKEAAVKPSPLWPPTTSMYDAETSVSEKLRFRYVVYTAIVAGYDDLKLPLNRPSNCDFVVFSDYPLEAPGWKVLPINYLTRDPTRAARFVKLHPHLYFPEYSHSIWLDGNIGVRGDVGTFFERLTDTAFLSAFVHPLRDCVYQEGRECIIRRKDHPEVINRHLDGLRARNIPEHVGLWESNVLVRRHNDRECIRLMRAWWRELESGSRRDQLGLPVVLRDFPGAAMPLDRPGISARRHPLLTFSSHRTQRKTRQSEAAWPASRSSRPDDLPISIVVCVHNSLEVVRDCLGSLAMAHRPGDAIIIVDDASDTLTASYLDGFARTQTGVRLIRNSRTLGYTRSANLGMKAAQTQWIVLLNSDTVTAPNSLRKLVAAGRRHPRLAVVGPLSNAASWQSVPRLMGDDGKFKVNPLPPGFDVAKMDALCERSALEAVMFVPLVNGFCLALRKDVLEEVGYFDEQGFPMGYGEEDDLCLRIAEAGYACGISTDSFVFHTKSATFTPERRELLVPAGRKELERKHGTVILEAASSTLRNNPGLRTMRQRLRSALEV